MRGKGIPIWGSFYIAMLLAAGVISLFTKKYITKYIIMLTIMYIMCIIIVGGLNMNFYSIKDFRADTKEVCEDVRKFGEAIITNNGKPTLLLLDIAEQDVEETLDSIRQARTMKAVNRMREHAARNGYMDSKEIGLEIKKGTKAGSGRNKIRD